MPTYKCSKCGQQSCVCNLPYAEWSRGQLEYGILMMQQALKRLDEIQAGDVFNSRPNLLPTSIPLVFESPFIAAEYFTRRSKVDPMFGLLVHTIAVEGKQMNAIVVNGIDFYGTYMDERGPQLVWLELKPDYITGPVPGWDVHLDGLPSGIHWPLIRSLMHGVVPSTLLAEWAKGRHGFHIDIVEKHIEDVNGFVDFCAANKLDH